MRVDVPESLADVGEGDAGREQMRAVGMAQRVEARALGQLQAAEEQRDGGGDRVRLQGRAVGVAEDEIALVALAEVVALRLLLLAMRMKFFERGRRQRHDAEFLVLRLLQKYLLPDLAQ